MENLLNEHLSNEIDIFEVMVNILCVLYRQSGHLLNQNFLFTSNWIAVSKHWLVSR